MFEFVVYNQMDSNRVVIDLEAFEDMDRRDGRFWTQRRTIAIDDDNILRYYDGRQPRFLNYGDGIRCT